MTAESVQTIQSMAKEHGFTMDLLADTKATTIKAYGVFDPGNGTSWPAIFIIGRDGKVLFHHITDNYRKRPPVADLLAVLDKK